MSRWFLNLCLIVATDAAVALAALGMWALSGTCVIVAAAMAALTMRRTGDRSPAPSDASATERRVIVERRAGVGLRAVTDPGVRATRAPGAHSMRVSAPS